MKISQINGTVNINGKSYQGQNVSVVNNKVFVDGVEVTDNEVVKAKEIKIEVYGDVNQVETVSGDIIVSGNVENVKTVSGDVKVFGSVTSNIKTVSGDIIKSKSSEESPVNKNSDSMQNKFNGATNIYKSIDWKVYYGNGFL